MKIQCIEKDVRQLLGSGGTYLIPRFQRPFSWDEDNVEEFWVDSTSDLKKDYFIGAFVAYNISSISFGLVDGQQRITTITIALCAIRDKFNDLGFPKLAGGVHNLIETRDLSNQPQFVLKTETSYPYLQAKIQSIDKQATDIDVGQEEEAIIAAYKLIQTLINQGVKDAASKVDSLKANDASKKWLVGVRDKILGLKVISITLDNQDDAYLIFETLNTRGKDLTAADLAKNHVLRLLPSKKKPYDQPAANWVEIQTTLDQANRPIQMATFLHHYWLSKHPFTTEKRLFKAIKGHVSPVNVRAVLDELMTDSNLYRGIMEPHSLKLWNKGNRDVEDSLRCISDVLKIQIANPLLLTVLRLFNCKKLKDGQVREIFWLVERYHYLHTTISNLHSSGGVSKMYAVHARELASADDANARGRCIKEFKQKIKSKVPARDTFITRFKALNYLTPRHKEIIGYTLWKIYTHRNPAVDIDRTRQSLEHLLSQNNNAPSMHSIGNLLGVPVVYNGDVLASNSFAKKKTLLKNHGYILEPEIDAATNWDSIAIDRRTGELAKFAYDEVWAIK